MWFILALLTAFFASLNDAFAKKFFSHLSHYEMAVFPMAYSCPFFLPVYLFIDSPPLDFLFYLSFLVSIPINGLAFIFSFAAVIGKVGILHSSPVYFSVSFFMVFNLVMIILLLAMKKISVANLLKYKFKGLLIGGAMFFHALFHCLAIALAKAAYMISIKRLSILFSVIYGGVFFDEKNIRMRIAGAVLMFLGSAMILLGE